MLNNLCRTINGFGLQTSRYGPPNMRISIDCPLTSLRPKNNVKMIDIGQLTNQFTPVNQLFHWLAVLIANIGKIRLLVDLALKRWEMSQWNLS